MIPREDTKYNGIGDVTYRARELREQLDKLIECGSYGRAPYGSSVLFKKKKNRRMRTCVDYGAINALMYILS
jgi:hypothetical protein